MKPIHPFIVVLIVSSIFLVFLTQENRPETIYQSKQGCCVIKVIENDADTDIVVYDSHIIDFKDAHLFNKERVSSEVEDYFLYCKNNHVNGKDISGLLK